MISKPLISVVMPVYNVEKFIRSAVQSILDQTFESFELIIIDDGSSDNTVNVIKSFKDNRIKLIEREHLGMVEQLNYGIQVSTGEYIARMDGDDISDNKRFEKQYFFLKDNPNIDIVGSNFIIINDEGIPIVTKELPQTNREIEFLMPIMCSVCHASILTKRICFEEVGYYHNYKYTEDVDLFLRLMLLNKNFYNLQEYLFFYRSERIQFNDEKLNVQRQTILKLGTSYLEKQLAKKTISDFNYRMALTYYYNGSVNLSRKYFNKCLINSPQSILRVLRYYIFTLFGNRIVWFLRNEGILFRINLIIKKMFKYDLQKVHSTKYK